MRAQLAEKSVADVRHGGKVAEGRIEAGDRRIERGNRRTRREERRE